jgi:PleD family two-component response regulator
LSIGIAELGDARSLDTLLARADLALYEAKRSGRNSVRTHCPGRIDPMVIDSIARP